MKECKAFQMSNPKEALEHIKNNFEKIKEYDLYEFDDGYRLLGRCKECNEYILIQSNEYHSFSNDKDSLYTDYFPVLDEKEVEELNEKYGGKSLENAIKRKILAATNGDIHWRDLRPFCYVDIRDKNEREKFINIILGLEGIILKGNGTGSFKLAKEKIINSVFPITIDFEKLEIDFIKNTTCAAASVTEPSKFMNPKDALERVRLRSEEWQQYKENVVISLIESSYSYPEEDAKIKVEKNTIDIFYNFFLKGETPMDCAIEIGYCCG